MPTYLMLSTLTDQGLRTLQSNPERLREVNRDIEELGAKVVHQWSALGPFDFVNVVEAPDEKTIAVIVNTRPAFDAYPDGVPEAYTYNASLYDLGSGSLLNQFDLTKTTRACPRNR